MKRLICKAKCTGFGSEMRSARCSFEHSYIEFQINGRRYHAFESKSMVADNFSLDKEYDLSFFPDGSYLKYCKVL